jgi:hypothetical protein
MTLPRIFAEHAMRVQVLIAALVFAAAPALGQQPAAPGAIKHTCTKPGDFPGNLGSEGQKRQWSKDYVAYTDCLKKFVDDQNKQAEPHIKAANETVVEYNAAVNSYNDIVKKDAERSK